MQKKHKKVHKMFVRRRKEGCFSTLIMRHLIDDETKFKEYFRVTKSQFNELVNIVSIDIKKKFLCSFCINSRRLNKRARLNCLTTNFAVKRVVLWRFVLTCQTIIISLFNLSARLNAASKRLDYSPKRDLTLFVSRRIPNLTSIT
ncbi:unnamed protein product [Psylliodes chrysocephalus]|uniref:Uncharacterized protein n=1 Tax=Psylliodes chrysocephalus TaxID=3402493 RepID=A0A9P0CGJ5_9CUCU|nr:unnamed protein product [Psylliodes chrysocephala]